MTMLGLTATQLKCLNFLRRRLATGVSPSFKEIAIHMGWSPKAKAHVRRTLVSLRDRGYIVWQPYTKRSIAFTWRICPNCHQKIDNSAETVSTPGSGILNGATRGESGTAQR